MATLLQEYIDLQPGTDYMRKLEAALYEQVATIRVEAANTANHEKRLIWAKNVEQNPADMVRRMKLAISLQIFQNANPPAELNGSSDVQMRAAVGQQVNNFIGD